MNQTLIELNARAEHLATVTQALQKADAQRSMTDCADGSCVVYFVQESSIKAVKIGTTKNLKNRLDTLRVNSPHEINVLGHVPGDERLEKYLHNLFRESHIRGEWHRPSDELLSCIEELKRGPLLLSDAERSLVEEGVATCVAPFAERPSRKKYQRQ